MKMSSFNVWMRKNAKLFFAVVCVILMVVWFVPFDRLISRIPVSGGRIFGKHVPGAKVQMTALSLALMMGPRARQEAQAVYAQAWETLILAEEAKRYGVQAGDEDLAEFLKMRFPAKDREFDEKEYHETLQRMGLTRRDFEDALRDVRSAGQLQYLIWRSASLTSDEAWAWYSREHERIQAAYIQIRAEDLAPLVKVDEAALREFHRKHADRSAQDDPNEVGYLEPEKVKIEYVMAPYAPYAADAVISRRQIATYYESHKESYRLPPASGNDKAGQPNYKPLSDVATEIETTLRKEEARRAADEVMKEVSDEVWKAVDVPFGSEEVRLADLAAVAKKYRLIYRKTDFFSAEQAATVVPGAHELAAKAFGKSAADIGKPTGPLSADEGRFLYQTLALQPPRPAPFEQVKDRVERDYRLAKALELATELAAKARAAGSLEAVTAKLESELSALLKNAPGVVKDPKTLFTRGTSAFFERPQDFGGQKVHYTTGLPGQFNYGNFAEAAFALKDGEVGIAVEPVRARAVFLLTRVGTRPADRAEFEKDRSNQIARLLERKRRAELVTWLAGLRRRASPSEEPMKYLALLPHWSGAAE